MIIEAATVHHRLESCIDVRLVWRHNAVLTASEVSDELDILETIVGETKHKLEATFSGRRVGPILSAEAVEIGGRRVTIRMINSTQFRCRCLHIRRHVLWINILLDEVDVLSYFFCDTRRRHIVQLLLCLYNLLLLLLLLAYGPLGGHLAAG